LHTKDIDIIEKFKEELNATYRIYSYKDKSSLIISSKTFVRNLVELGCVPNKTKSLKFPTLEEKFVWSFIKGCFDGDGSYVFTDKSMCINFTSASDDFIYELNSILSKHNISNSIVCQDSYKRVHINSKESIRKFIENILECECVGINRKNDIMYNILNSSRLQYANGGVLQI
jgi:intein/homing endonuclease